ncbi:DNA mismatch repair endonuclease MutL [bacterium]|nr:DNA mismatch repair endonuclease MutL [candidate division CSSED10-310 bacterium]
MVGKIMILPEYISNRIAAGEIIERPASVVRELLDNAIDAGADRIEIEIEQGGAILIRVTDNGHGFDPDGLLLAFERHATSKVRSLEDLDSIRTLGFRGEALPSIASVAQVSVESFCIDCSHGAKLRINGGKVDSLTQTACAPGTKISVRNLFYNTPARRKFLKSVKTEFSQIHETVIDHAVTYPMIHFLLKDRQQIVIDAPAVDLWTARLTALFGKKFMSQYIPVRGLHPDILIQGVICQPEFLRATGRSQRLFVNGRRIRDKIITQAVYRGYSQFITGHGHPAYILRIDMPPESVDVNVHPAKSEVRFRDSNGVFNLVSTLVSQALTGSMRVQFDLRSSSPKRTPTEPDLSSREWRIPDGGDASRGDVIIGEQPHSAISQPMPDNPIEPGKLPTLPLIHNDDWTLVGQAFNTFILIEIDRFLLVIDQHTAHERLLFEKFKNQYRAGQIPSQSLLFPVPVELETPQYSTIHEFTDLLRTMGLILEPFGKNTFAVRALPEHIAQESPELLLKNLADELMEVGTTERSRIAERKMLVSLSCRKAVKAGDPLSRAEMEGLVRALIENEIPNACPHGRPIIVPMEHEEISRRFKR